MTQIPLGQKGFTPIHAVLIGIIVAIVGGTGFFVYNANKKSNDSLNQAAKISQSSPSKAVKKPAATSAQATAATAKAANVAQINILDCFKKPQLKPSEIVLTCADANTIAENIIWSRWTADGAAGVGDIKANDCNPACAGGHFHNYPANFILGNPKIVGQTTYFTSLDVQYTAANPGQKSTENYPLSTP